MLSFLRLRAVLIAFSGSHWKSATVRGPRKPLGTGLRGGVGQIVLGLFQPPLCI